MSIGIHTELMKKNYQIFKADMNTHREEIQALWERNFPAVPEHRFTWIYENNPRGPAICWLAKDVEQDKVVGATSLFPRKFSIHRSPVLAGIAGDFVVDKEHRGFGPSLALQHTVVSHSQEARFDFLYGISGKQAELVHRRAGYHIVGQVVRMIKPLKVDKYFQRGNGVPWMKKNLAKPLNVALSLLSKEQYSAGPKNYRLERISVFDRRFDDLWEKASSRYPVIGERTGEYLNWRFTHTPHKSYTIFTLTHKKDDEILGYIVSHVVNNHAYIADLLCIDNTSVFNTLVSRFLLFVREEGLDSVSITCMGDRAVTKKLKGYGFFMRASNTNVIAYVDPDSPLTSTLSEPNNWYLTEGDNDV